MSSIVKTTIIRSNLRLIIYITQYEKAINEFLIDHIKSIKSAAFQFYFMLEDNFVELIVFDN